VLSTSFADIFRNNALKNGLLPVVLPPEVHARLVALVREDPDAELRVDLERCTVTLPGGETVGFEVDSFSRQMLLDGTDELGFLLAGSEAVAAYEAAHPPRVDTTAQAGG
jgi:3-isopropylmalate/(R)-2-methylmalate dehydratase small subunit